VSLALAVPAPVDLALVEACEQRIINAWPAVETLIIAGFAVRFAHGYSGRANSASPLAAGAVLDDEALALIERLYAVAGLPPCVRVNPLCAADTRPRLLARGYRVKDSSLGMVADALSAAAPGLPAGCALQLDTAATPEWVRGVSARQSGDKRDADAALLAIVSRIRLPAAFATLVLEGEPAGFGLVVAERGMAEIGSIVVDGRHRGRGLGRGLMQGLLAAAAALGAARAFLQVEERNAPALALYRGLGFRPVYRYDTLVRDGRS
jgi:ribosomal protein S18 acetylase RimI-like enzyme